MHKATRGKAVPDHILNHRTFQWHIYMSSKAIVTKFIVSGHELFKYSMRADRTLKFIFRPVQQKNKAASKKKKKNKATQDSTNLPSETALLRLQSEIRLDS